MRIVAGTYRGRTIDAPPGRDTRPTADRVREGLFSAVIARLGALDGAVVLDLFAGSGALGFEALSRGARHVTFVERHAGAVRTIAANAERLRVPVGSYALLRRPVEAVPALVPSVGPASLLFVDPPYRIGAGVVAEVLTALVRAGWIAPQALICYEHAATEDVRWPMGFVAAGELRYGDTSISLGWHEPDGTGDV